MEVVPVDQLTRRSAASYPDQPSTSLVSWCQARPCCGPCMRHADCESPPPLLRHGPFQSTSSVCSDHGAVPSLFTPPAA
eukprot:CAMPEP_0115878442 /NCGR_PEP_ID=MMETSP0287-20121206/26772_1 /TAXON_ID=412157 /ORGANISM="Chrysochromulina rotalis, Strain UIO044" /LENGTH=78 /DNA_ID=CAMNT_0003334051 /DNA_START=30 /DNA_END=263 /DNA_ORIENTATION=-